MITLSNRTTRRAMSVPLALSVGVFSVRDHERRWGGGPKPGSRSTPLPKGKQTLSVST